MALHCSGGYKGFFLKVRLGNLANGPIALDLGGGRHDTDMLVSVAGSDELSDGDSLALI